MVVRNVMTIKCEGSLKELGIFFLEKRRFHGDRIAIFKYLREEVGRRIGFFFVGNLEKWGN